MVGPHWEQRQSAQAAGSSPLRAKFRAWHSRAGSITGSTTSGPPPAPPVAGGGGSVGQSAAAARPWVRYPCAFDIARIGSARASALDAEAPLLDAEDGAAGADSQQRTDPPEHRDGSLDAVGPRGSPTGRPHRSREYDVSLPEESSQAPRRIGTSRGKPSNVTLPGAEHPQRGDNPSLRCGVSNHRSGDRAASAWWRAARLSSRCVSEVLTRSTAPHKRRPDGLHVTQGREASVVGLALVTALMESQSSCRVYTGL